MDNDNLRKLRHSAAHLLAHAVLELFPDTKLTIGPVTDDGFFYDFLPTKTFKDEDLITIEKKMRELAQENIPITQKEISKEEARKLYKDNQFKQELIDAIPGDTVGIATQGNFYDLCKGGHVPSTGHIKHFKLLNISGAYWRADKNQPALQRIAGTAFFSAQELADYERFKEEAAKYDHRKLGKQLDLFSFHDEGPGFPFFHPKGKVIINILTQYLQRLLKKAGYLDIATPIMLSDELWRQSGHYEHYKKNMYFCEKEGRNYAIRPMNCPGAILIYKERLRSFRELPLRLSELGLVHRFELSGVLHGLFRARAFTIDDGHIFCTTNQIEAEVLNTITMIYEVLRAFGFSKISVALSTRPDDSMGDDILWEKATTALQNALNTAGVSYDIHEGEGAFYGPKIEFRIEDSMKREWQCSTVQLDFFLPERFDLTYTASGGTKERTVMIHRAIYGSLERFLGVLLEHYKGKLPFGLAPVQTKILPITDQQKEYAHTILNILQERGIRTELDDSSDQISAQIKHAQQEQVPWMLIIGKKEVTNNTVTLRHRDGTQEFGLSIEDIITRAQTQNSYSS